MNLPYDMCRCEGIDCDRKDECLRFRTIEADKTTPGLIWVSMCGRLCSEGRDYFISIKGGK